MIVNAFHSQDLNPSMVHMSTTNSRFRWDFTFQWIICMDFLKERMISNFLRPKFSVPIASLIKIYSHIVLIRWLTCMVVYHIWQDIVNLAMQVLLGWTAQIPGYTFLIIQIRNNSASLLALSLKLHLWSFLFLGVESVRIVYRNA